MLPARQERCVNYHSPGLEEGSGLTISLSPLPFVFCVPTAWASKLALLLRENISSQRLQLRVNIAGLNAEGIRLLLLTGSVVLGER